jgi:hypothetical protein
VIADPTIEVYGTDGEPCTGCRAPLTGTQRYCLHCGTRRPQARAEFLDILAADAREFGLAPGTGYGGSPAPPVLPVVPGGGAEDWLRARSPFLALGGLLLATLLIGLLIGHWAAASSPSAAVATPAPQVIRIQGGAATTAAAPAAAAGAGPTAADAGSTKKTPANAKAVKAVTVPKNVKDVSKLSKHDVEKAAKKGQPLSTGSGTLPPTDNKPAASGTGFQDIG